MDIKEKKKVLLVDDEKEVVDFLEHFLKRFNILPIKATSGEEALLMYEKYHPHFIFLDIQMPDKDGLTVFKELKKMDSAIKVIMITGKEEKEFQQSAKKLGAIDYIIKPVDLAELSEKVKKYII